MNKAFVRDPEPTGEEHCPRCGSLSPPVGREILHHHVHGDAVARLADSGYFCPYASCDVAYFDQFGRVAMRGELVRPVYPKDLDAPICACFGLTMADIEQDIREGKPTRVRELLAKANTPEARCARLAADGQCCVPTVQRVYLQLRNAPTAGRE